MPQIQGSQASTSSLLLDGISRCCRTLIPQPHVVKPQMLQGATRSQQAANS